MSKSSSGRSRKTAKKNKSKKPGKTTLTAISSVISVPANVAITFRSGLGQATVSLFRKGLLINMQSISLSGSIHFSDVDSGDGIAVNGVCTGQASITIDVPTNPSTPTEVATGVFNIAYDVV